MFLEENPHGPKKVFQYTAVFQYNDQGDALAIQESTTRKGKFKSSIPKSHSESLRLKENKTSSQAPRCASCKADKL